MSTLDPLSSLRTELARVEHLRLFDGNEYPDPLTVFPWPLSGRGFFPGGDGLWRDPTPSGITGPATIPFPVNGVMFVGQDFGTVDKYPPQSRPWEQDNVATWKFLVKRIIGSGLPGSECFFTNALLGLRKKGSTIGQNECVSIPLYAEICRKFLAYQIQVQNPRMIVLFASVNKSIYSSVISRSYTLDTLNKVSTINCFGRERIVFVTQHPSSDHGVISRSPSNYKARCNVLSEGWQRASRLA
jgi:hypothetical protein